MMTVMSELAQLVLGVRVSTWKVCTAMAPGDFLYEATGLHAFTIPSPPVGVVLPE